MADDGITGGAVFNTDDMDDFNALAMAGGLGGASIGDMCVSGLTVPMSLVDPVHAATTFGALLFAPDLQSNCLRIEALTPFAVACGGGRREATGTSVAHSFAAMGEGTCGWLEDPAEDVFVGTVRSPRGNFRLLEGIWEGNAFYLQVFLDAIERMPSASGYEELRSAAFALLRLSELACDRAGLSRHQLGEGYPVSHVATEVLDQLPALRAAIRFTPAELASASIDERHLAPFIFRVAERSRIMDEQLGDTSLERQPLLRDQGGVVLVLPTAVSAAIRRFVVERLSSAGMAGALAKGLANAYAIRLSEKPFLGGSVGAPIVFSNGSTPVAHVMLQVDAGRYCHALLFADGLQSFDEAGLAGMDPAGFAIGPMIERGVRDAFEGASADPAYVGGLTLVVSCGIGRGVAFPTVASPDANWRIEAISAYDFQTLSLLEGFTPLKLWRILDLRDRANALGLSVGNLNGLINLIGWARQLGGDLIPHGHLPDDAIEAGRSFTMMIDQASQRQLRRDVAVSRDPRVAPHPRLGLLRIMKDSSSAFDDDNAAPLYVSDAPGGGSVPSSAYLAPKRTWWTELEVAEGTPGPLLYDKWRGVAMWLSRAAPILDGLVGLPDGPVVWRAVFEADLITGPSAVAQMTFERARAAIRVEVDHAASTVITRASAPYEDAVFHPENIAEHALMAALIDGVAELAGLTGETAPKSIMLAKMVPNVHVRHGHAFRAAGFREREGSRRGGRVLKVSEEDSAMVKLGFGWRARGQAEGSRVEGKAECLSFLGKLVKAAEDELCADLRAFERQAILELLLRNMEAAASDRDRWGRTAAAVLALHADKEATLRTMAQHEFQLNAVFQASRILVEIAICESEPGIGRKPGDVDVSLLMAKANQLFEVGGWSDAIR